MLELLSSYILGTLTRARESLILSLAAPVNSSKPPPNYANVDGLFAANNFFPTPLGIR